MTKKTKSIMITKLGVLFMAKKIKEVKEEVELEKVQVAPVGESVEVKEEKIFLGFHPETGEKVWL